MFPLSIYFTFFLVKNVKLIYLLHFSMIIITSVNNSRNRDISLTSVRCLFCQLQYVMCDFLRSKSFVPQCNNTISGAKSTIQPLTWWLPSVVAPGIDFTVVTYFVLFFILYGYMFLTMESPTINNLFVIWWDCCDIFLAFFFSDLLVLLMQSSKSDETKLFSAGSVSSSIYKVIRPILNFFLFFFYDKISQAPNSTKKHYKALKSTKKY